MDCGIYLITNLVNGKVYVGSSKIIQKRKGQHFSDLKNNKHSNPHLQNAWNLDGEDNFQWEVLMNCDEEDLLYWEDYHINFFDARNPKQGYNLRTAERGKMAEETKLKIAEGMKGKKNYLASPVGLNASKTHCPKGHSYDKENTRYKRNRRICRKCEKEQRRIKHLETYISHPKESPKFCPVGHEYTEKNIYLRKNGVKDCKTCNRERARKKREGLPKKQRVNTFAKGHIPWNKGKKMTEEARLKMIESKTGKPWSEARRAAYEDKKLSISQSYE